ncbi:MAG TPA: hypothetical protein VGX23_32280 [Actinocrinis sp.]|nr:hypothetical protein [Actinocrinis sp.]
MASLGGCSAHSSPSGQTGPGSVGGPGGPLAKVHLELSAQAGQGGAVDPPVATKTVTIHGANGYLSVDLDVFPGVDWAQSSTANASTLQDQGPQEYSTPEPCATVSAVCQSTWSEQYQAQTTGTTTLTWTLYAAPASPTASQTAPPTLPANAPTCPTGSITITAPPPQSDADCVLGHVTVTVIVTG